MKGDKTLLSLIGQKGIDNLNSYIDNYVGQTGKCSKASVAAAGLSLIYGLHQYGYHITYYLTGGHGTNKGVNPKWGTRTRTVITPNGNANSYLGLDCSGFVSWCMNEAGIKGSMRARNFAATGKEISFESATGGDLLANKTHVILIIENKGSYLQTAESTTGGVQFTKKTKSQAKRYKVVDMSSYYSKNCTL